jgi:hypothetical protein
MNLPNTNSPAPVQDHADQLSRLRQRLRQQLSDLEDLSWTLGDSGPMIMGSYYQVFKSCTQKNCKCQRGEKHGPFPALSWSVDGKRRMVMVKEADSTAVQQKVTTYRRYQKSMVKIRHIMTSIDETLSQIRSLLLEEYPKR